MMISFLKIVLFLVIIILPFRGPRKRKEQHTGTTPNQAFSEYVVTEDGNLDFVKNEKDAKGT